MKQKNVVLVVVAVGCGMLAAILSTQISAGGKKAEETIPVLVASKDLPIGTRLKKEEIDSFLETKEFTKATVPAQYIATKDELADKAVTRTIRKGDAFNPQDVTKSVSLSPPPGYDMMAIACSLEQGVAGFARPGSKVDVLAAIPVKGRGGNGASSAVVPLMLDMLVLAVDSEAQIKAEQQVAPNMSMVSLAVKPEQSLLLHGAVDRGAKMRLVLRNQEAVVSDKDKYAGHQPSEKELWALLADQPSTDDGNHPSGEGQPPGNGGPKPKEETVKLAVAREDLAAGTQLTDAVIDAKFEMKEFAKPAPAQGVENLRQYAGKTLNSNLTSGQYVPKSFLGEKDKAKAAPADGTTSKENTQLPTKPKPPEAPPVYHDYTVQTPNGLKTYRLQKFPDGRTKYLGEVPHDGTADKVDPDEKDDKPKAKPAEPEKKGEKKGERV